MKHIKLFEELVTAIDEAAFAKLESEIKKNIEAYWSISNQLEGILR